MRIAIPFPDAADVSGADAREALKRRLQRPGTPMARALVRTLVAVYLLLIGGVPLAAAALPAAYAASTGARVALIVLSPVLYTVAYVLVCGCLSRITVRAIVPGKMVRDLGHFVYGRRRLYGLCWTSIYYFPQLYHAVLTLPALKKVVFRLFGYRGSTDFVVYPDTWIRDLPLLDIGPGAYVANRATIGSNICLQSGEIVVNRIVIGARAMIGHLAILGPGDVIGDDVEVGVGTAFGVNVRVGARTRIGAIVGVNHGAQIGSDCDIESMVYIGKKAVIADGIKVHYASVIPDRAVVRTQDESDKCMPAQVARPVERTETRHSRTGAMRTDLRPETLRSAGAEA